MTEFFLRILNMSIAASWLVPAVLLLRLALKKGPKWINLLLWGLVAFRLLCPFSFESAFSLIPSAETIPEKIISGPSFDIQTGIAPMDNRINAYLGDRYFEGVTVPANNGFHVMTALTILWGMGVLLLLAYAVISDWRLRRRIETAVRYRDNIFQSENVSTPFVLGLFRAKIYLPFHMKPRELEYVIAHEQGHIHRGDHWWKPLGFLLLAVHWFNPLIWLSYVLFCRDVELACDEKVIRPMNHVQRGEYTQALLDCSAKGSVFAPCPPAFGEIGVKDRVKSVLHYKKPAFWMLLLALLLCAAAALCFLTDPKEDRYTLRFTVPAGETNTVLYAQEELSPQGKTITLTASDAALVWLEPVEVRQETAYEPLHLSAGEKVRLEVEKGAWFRLGLVGENHNASPCSIRLEVEGVQLRIASEKLPGKAVLEGQILAVYEGYYLLQCAHSPAVLEVPIQNLPAATEPRVGDRLRVTYTGGILETAPGRIQEVCSIELLSPVPEKFYLTIGAEGVQTLEISQPGQSGGCENADGSPLQKGERIWLESLEGLGDLRGVEIRALDAAGRELWSVSFPDTEEYLGRTQLQDGDWAITTEG